MVRQRIYQIRLNLINDGKNKYHISFRVGNTKLVARIMKNVLEKENIYVYFKSVEDKIDVQEIATSYAIIFGFPVYHGAPSTSMKLFIEDNEWLLW